MDTEYVLTRGISEILPSKAELARLMNKRKISLYQGFDPTAKSLHLGNLIGIRKLAQFQKLGHKVTFLVGDFTGMIGDPTDKSSARKKLSKAQAVENAKGWKAQIKDVISFEGPNAAEFKYNSEWLAKLTSEELLELASNLTYQQTIERDFFQERIKKNETIYLHEFLYPLLQGYDSVAQKIDLEIGGSDQLFNMLVGRTLVKKLNKKEKYVLTVKLLEDPTGKKMGKTEGNVINLTDSPGDIFGKIMALPDSLIIPGIELMTDLPVPQGKIANPLELKKSMALEVTAQIHGRASALEAKREFEKVFQKRDIPSDIAVIKVKEESLPLLDLVFSTKAVSSRSEAKRLIAQMAIEVNSKVVSEPNSEISLKDGVIIRIGKVRFFKIEKK